MTRNDLPAPTQACLDDVVLRAYNLGIMPEAMLERVASHLAVCQRCESVLESVGGTEDAFLQNLRQYLRDAPPLSEEGAAETGPELASNFRQPPTTRIGLGALPRRFGNYEVLESLAISGMSIVFKARQLHPNRLVALKVPRCAPLEGTEAFERFQLEIEAIAQLQHDHIVRIYECGEEEGVRYFSMEYMEEGSLAAKLAGSPLAERAAAQLVHTLARAVQFAHQQGIVHRDLKPGNVLLGAEGSVKLTDFGLAKWLDGDAGLTQSHAIMGTAKYMAPEQARGDSKHVGVLTDVYGLGTILYECLTGRAPFSAGSQKEVLHLVETSPPVAPSKLRRGLSRNLEAICLKCLEKSPERRYASAERLANDLENWLNQRPTEARPPRWPARVYRKARRHVIALSLMAAVLVGLAAIPVLDPERPIRQIERKLANRQPVTLIGETGKPSWFRIRLGEESTKVSLGEDGSFSVHSWALCLVELVRDPQQDRYRIRAQVRHENSDPLGEVGIYLAHRAYPGAKADIHVFTQLSFNDVREDNAQANSLPPGIPIGPHPDGNVVELFTHIYSAKDQREFFAERIAGVSGVHFKPKGENSRWYDLEVRVAPENLRAIWNGQLVGELPAPKAVDRLAKALVQWRRRRPNEPFFQNIPADLPLRGSIGLYVYRGSASFRCVQVDPERDKP